MFYDGAREKATKKMSLYTENLNMSAEKSQQNGNIVSYKIENFSKVDESIRIAFLNNKGRQLRLNGLPSLLSGIGVGSVTKTMLEAISESGSGLSKEQCTVIRISINKLMIQLSCPDLEVTEERIIPA